MSFLRKRESIMPVAISTTEDEKGWCNVLDRPEGPSLHFGGYKVTLELGQTVFSQQ